MTLTTQQQAAASAAQLVQQGNQIISAIARIKTVLDNGQAANTAAGLPGFAASDLDAALGTANLAVLNALVAALPAS